MLKARKDRIVLVALFLAEMVAGVFSESLSYTALGAFLMLASLGFFSKRRKNGIAVTVTSLLLFLYVAVLSFFEMIQSVGYYSSAPAFWIFPAALLFFFARAILEKGYGTGENGGFFFSFATAVFCSVTLVCTALSLFVEYYFEPVWALSLSVGGIYLLLKNLNWSKR